MTTKAIPIIVITLIALFSMKNAIGQNTQKHRVSFNNLDGFSGYVDFETSRTGFTTRLTAKKNATLVLNNYDCTKEEKEILQAAGFNFWRVGGYRPEKFSLVIEGRAYLSSPSIPVGSSYAIDNSKLQISNSLGAYTTPEFDTRAKEYADKWQKENKSSFWEKYGSFDAKTVEVLYLSDLKNDMDKVIGQYNREKERFNSYISQGTHAANGFDFEAAEEFLNKAVALADGKDDRDREINDLERLIENKKKEEEQAKEEEQERFSSYISQGTHAANSFDFETAKELLNKAIALADGKGDRYREINDLEKLIEDKKMEEGQEKETDEKTSNDTYEKEEKEKRGKEEVEKVENRKSESSATSMGISEIIKGDVAYNQGNYTEAIKHYDMAKRLGVRVDDTKYNDASAKAAGQSLAELAGMIPEATYESSSVYLAYESSGFWEDQYRFGLQGRAFYGNTFFFPYSISGSYAPTIEYDNTIDDKLIRGIKEKNIFGIQFGFGIGFALFNDEDFSIYLSGQGIFGTLVTDGGLLYAGFMPSIGIRMGKVVVSFDYGFYNSLLSQRVPHKDNSKFGNISLSLGLVTF